MLTSAVVIEPEPLNPIAAAGYLDRCLPPRSRPAWEQILTHLRTAPALPGGPGAALAEVAATPLGLWLLRAVYITPAADPAALRDPDRFANAAHYVPTCSTSSLEPSSTPGRLAMTPPPRSGLTATMIPPRYGGLAFLRTT